MRTYSKWYVNKVIITIDQNQTHPSLLLEQLYLRESTLDMQWI